jgi:LysR family hydrogen peroxide-inducible transcriptional activator
VLPTSAGAPLLDRARRLLREADDLASAARGAGDPLAGALTVGVIPTISPYLLPAVTPALRAAFPRLQLQWVEDKTATLSALLDRGALDAAVVAWVDGLGDVDHAEVATDPFVLATAPDHPLARRTGPVRARDLAGQQVLLLDDGHCFRDQALAFCAGASARELGFRATSLPTLAQMVAGGAGVTLLPALAVPTEAGRAGLRVRPFADPVPGRTVALVWRRTSPIALGLRTLAGVVRAHWPTG